MLNLYCGICGLYIQVPDDFGGGKGQCPRCKTLLRIPKPLTPDDEGYVEGLRYYADAAQKKVPTYKARPITNQCGPSVKFRCTKCTNQYQSIQTHHEAYARCPVCGCPGIPFDGKVEFPRLEVSPDAYIPANAMATKRPNDFSHIPMDLTGDPNDIPMAAPADHHEDEDDDVLDAPRVI